MKTFQWSLRDLDETDIESLIPFIARVNKGNDQDEVQPQRLVYCDQLKGF